MRERAPAPPSVRGAPRRASWCCCSHAAAQACSPAHRPDRSVDGRRVGCCRLHQPAPVQRGRPLGLRPPAAGVAARATWTSISQDRVRLPYRPPYAWAELIGFLAERAMPSVEAVDGGVLRRALRIDGEAVVVEVEHGGRGAPPARRPCTGHRPFRLAEASPCRLRRCGRSGRDRRVARRRSRRSVRSSGTGRASASRAPGTASSSRCGPSSASRCRCAARRLRRAPHPALRRSAPGPERVDNSPVPPARGSRSRARRSDRHAGCARRDDPRPCPRSCGGRARARAVRRIRDDPAKAGRDPRNRRLDGRVRRDACASGSRRLPRRRPRAPSGTRVSPREVSAGVSAGDRGAPTPRFTSGNAGDHLLREAA